MIKRRGIKYSIKKYENLEYGYTKISHDAFRIISNGNCFIIYCYLCKNHNIKYGYAFPSLKDIEDNTGISKKTVIKCLIELEDLKLIKKLKFTDKKGYANNCYRVYVPTIQEVEEIIEMPQLTEEQIKELEELESNIYFKEEEEIIDEEDEMDI